MSAIDLAELASLPDLVRSLQARVEELSKRLTLAERKALTVAQAARALGVCQRTIRRRIEAGELQHEWTGKRVSIYLPC